MANSMAASSLTALALHIPIEDILIPISAYLQDRKVSPDIHAPYSTGRRAFSASSPLPKSYDGRTRLPRVLRETTCFLLLPNNVTTEGIFRISAPAKVRSILKESYDRGQKFIIWKDQTGTLPLPHYPTADDTTALLEEIDFSDTYGVHLAASLIKLWYSDLREPLLPASSYVEFRRYFDDQELSVDLLVDFLSPHSEWSCLTDIARRILTTHLFPLLFEVVKHKEENKMTSENLAVCFAPTFVCGEDQMEDIKISNTVKAILKLAIDSWAVLREIFHLREEDFWDSLKAPTNIDDYEDPLYERPSSPTKQNHTIIGGTVAQSSGIVMKDNESYDSDYQTDDSGDLTAPPLPPRSSKHGKPPLLPVLPPRPSSSSGPPLPQRPPTSNPTSNPTSPQDYSTSPISPVRRKPAPPLGIPAHAIAANHHISNSPASYTGPVDGFGPPRRSGWSVHGSDSEGPSPISTSSRTFSSGVPRRKPVGSGDEPKETDVKNPLHHHPNV
jgi:Rho GTPase-activating protein 1